MSPFYGLALKDQDEKKTLVSKFWRRQTVQGGDTLGRQRLTKVWPLLLSSLPQRLGGNYHMEIGLIHLINASTQD